PADTTPPNVPTGLAKTGSTATSISLTWTASTDPNSAVAGYNIYRGGVKIGSTASTIYTDSGLAANTTYSYAVSAYDPTGNTSGRSSPLNAATSTCTISVTQNTYADYDGWVTYQNRGSGSEVNPIVNFTIPSGATLDTTGCEFSNQTAPGSTAVRCTQSGRS